MLRNVIVVLFTVAASSAFAGEKEFRCTSDVSEDEIQIFQGDDPTNARLIYQDTEGTASVAHGLDGVTFIHIKPDEVWTLVLHFPTMTYELSTHGATTLEDHGHCTTDG
ncbi:hypothetical protein HW561_16365 [Rhodobacteraceae bacterium B1Z28]|uniref:Uncharacterized protein n=1 Tax=Ruegeria haliotis TaxID=2747601 RepID=A0ABX2PT69_9RHOB|nr:hypothetical protein [Ruegeria haliotis]NVO57370.1 hypothetical protein [Ruegeria haliotis]